MWLDFWYFGKNDLVFRTSSKIIGRIPSASLTDYKPTIADDMYGRLEGVVDIPMESEPVQGYLFFRKFILPPSTKQKICKTKKITLVLT